MNTLLHILQDFPEFLSDRFYCQSGYLEKFKTGVSTALKQYFTYRPASPGASVSLLQTNIISLTPTL